MDDEECWAEERVEVMVQYQHFRRSKRVWRACACGVVHVEEALYEHFELIESCVHCVEVVGGH